MFTELVNGYNVTGNHGVKAAREYHVCNAAGNVLARLPGMMLAIADATAREPGDIPEPEPEPTVETKPKQKIRPRVAT